MYTKTAEKEPTVSKIFFTSFISKYPRHKQNHLQEGDITDIFNHR